VDKDAMEAVVSCECAIDVGGAKSVREVAIGGAHRLDVSPGEPEDTERRRQRLQGSDDREGVARVARRERRNPRVAVRLRLDEAVLLESCEGLPDRRAAEAEPLGELGVLELLARLERPVEDRVAKTCVRLVAEKRAGGTGTLAWDWNVKYYISVERNCQPFGAWAAVVSRTGRGVHSRA
jgi:hypothetical protein